MSHLSRLQKFEFLRTVVRGLQHAHRRDVRHRDIKAENILMGTDAPYAVIADWGLARSSGGRPSNEAIYLTGSGTPSHMPPELFSRLDTDPDDVWVPHSDVYHDLWSVGILIQEIFGSWGGGVSTRAWEIARNDDPTFVLYKEERYTGGRAEFFRRVDRAGRPGCRHAGGIPTPRG